MILNFRLRINNLNSENKLVLLNVIMGKLGVENYMRFSPFYYFLNDFFAQ